MVWYWTCQYGETRDRLECIAADGRKVMLADDANEKRKDIVNLYPGSKQVWVDSGYDIPKEKPKSVIEAVREVLYPEKIEGHL